MNKPDRFLLGILALAALLIVVSLIAVILQGRAQEPPPEAGTPARVVWDYHQAVREGRYADAVQLIAPRNPPDAAEFAAAMGRQSAVGSRQDRAERLRFGETVISDEQATVTVYVSTVHVSDPFSQSAYERTETVSLKKIAGQWRITSYFYPYWSFEWDRSSPEVPSPKGGD